MHSTGVSRVNSLSSRAAAEQFPIGEPLVAKLNRMDAGLDQRNHQPLELPGDSRPSTST